MSDSVERAEAVEGQAMGRLEAAVDRLVEEHAAALGQLADAESRVRELEAHLAASAKDGTDPVVLRETITKLQEQNADLKNRIGLGREGVDRLLSRIRFLEQRR